MPPRTQIGPPTRFAVSSINPSDGSNFGSMGLPVFRSHTTSRPDGQCPPSYSTNRRTSGVSVCLIRFQILIKQTDTPEVRRFVEYEGGHCPSGRLVVWDRKTGKPIEPKFEPSLGLIEDTAKRVGGPIWVRGGIPVTSADGKTKEIRNQLTLCRCGTSANKPFCDGSHAT